MNSRNSIFSMSLCSAVVMSAVAVLVPLATAQQPIVPAHTSLVLSSALEPTATDFRYRGEEGNSTTAVSTSAPADAVAAERENLSADADQPPPRRRVYGRPRYADRMHNADGSTKIAFEAGAGFATPAGSTAHYQTVNFKFSVGAGLNFSKKFGILGQFDYDRMNVPESTLATMAAAYQPFGIDTSGLDANTHIWSISANPVYNYYVGEKAGAYVVGGVGYARKTTNFTLPSTSYYCDYYGFCYPIQTNQTFDNYTNGGVMLNGGLGFTYKISHFGNEKLFAEARYQWVNTKADNTGFYPPNSYRTGYFPVTVGVRF